LKGPVRLDRSECACLVVTGTDRQDFLNRMATNDLAALEPGRAAPTFFLERTGRVVDRAVVLECGDRAILLGSVGRGRALAEWLGKHVIADDVAIADEGTGATQFLVMGEGAAGVLEAELGIAAGPLDRWEHRASDGVRVVRVEDVGGSCYRAFAAGERGSALDAALRRVPLLAADEWRALRVAAGIPEFGAEFTARTIPLETRQFDHFSFTKGCYVGQEVVARLHNYKRVKRALVRLRITGRNAPAAGAALFDADREVGVVTSAGGAGDSVLALGYVETGFESPGRRLALHDGGATRDAEVLTLTFQGDAS
jgi:folate-binding protein YgfZ